MPTTTQCSEESRTNLLPLTLPHGEFKIFRFFDLPFELRFKILEMALVTDKVYCLDPHNYRAGRQRLNIFLTSRGMHEDAYRVFYGGHTFRIFPTHGRFFGSRRKPLVSRLPPRYKEALLSLELRLGPGWAAPPKSWSVTTRLGLEKMTRVRVLKVFVECDPSLDTFRGFRVSTDFYTKFSQQLLEDVLKRLPGVTTVEIDGWPAVPSRGHLITGIICTAKKAGLSVVLSTGMAFHQSRNEVCEVPPIALSTIDRGITVS